MRSQDGVVIKDVHRIMAGPFAGHLDGLELRDAGGQNGPDMAFPQAVIHGEIVILHRRVIIGMAAALIGAAAVFAHMHARRINGQRQIAVQRFFGLEHPGKAFARLDRQIDPGHRRRARGAWAGCVDDLPASDHLPGCQRHAVDARAIRAAGQGDHFIGDVFDAAFARLPAPPVEHRRAVPVAFIHGVDAAQHDVIDGVERIALRDLRRGQQFGRRARRVLDGQVFAQRSGKGFGIGQIQVSERTDRQVRHPFIAAHVAADILHEIRRELGNPHVQRVGKLLAHAGIGVRCRTELIAGIAFDNQHAPVKIRVLGQEPGGGRPHDRPADDDDVIGLMPWVGRHCGKRHQKTSPLAARSKTSAICAGSML